MSTGCWNRASIRRPSRASRSAWIFDRLGRCRRCSGTGADVVPPAARTVITSLVAVRCLLTRPERRSTTKVSGLTSPPTTASPRPQAALMVIALSSPVTGSTVNITPEVCALIIRWTTTATATSASANPWRAR